MTPEKIFSKPDVLSVVAARDQDGVLVTTANLDGDDEFASAAASAVLRIAFLRGGVHGTTLLSCSGYRVRVERKGARLLSVAYAEGSEESKCLARQMRSALRGGAS